MNRAQLKSQLLSNLTIPKNELLSHLNQSTCTTAKNLEEWLDTAPLYHLPNSLYLPVHYYDKEKQDIVPDLPKINQTDEKAPSESVISSSNSTKFPDTCSLPETEYTFKGAVKVKNEQKDTDDTSGRLNSSAGMNDSIYSQKFEESVTVKMLEERIAQLNEMHSDLLILNNRLSSQIREQQSQIEVLNDGGRRVIMAGKNLIRATLSKPVLLHKNIPIKGHHEYTLTVEIGQPDCPMGEQYCLKKRFRDFVKLRNELNDPTHSSHLPVTLSLAFPPKLNFPLTEKIGNQRKMALNAWLSVVLKHTVDCDPDFHANPSRDILRAIFPFLTVDYY